MSPKIRYELPCYGHETIKVKAEYYLTQAANFTAPELVGKFKGHDMKDSLHCGQHLQDVSHLMREIVIFIRDVHVCTVCRFAAATRVCLEI